GRIFSDGKKVELQVMTRCESEELERKILHQHEKVARSYGFTIGIVGYDAWHQEAVNPLTAAVKEAYLAANHQPIDVTGAQVGLETAYFRSKAPWLTMVTLGADIEDAHSTLERVKIDSVETMYRLMTGALEKLNDREKE